MARAPASILVAVMAVMAGAGVSFAQTTSVPPKDHSGAGNHLMSGPSMQTMHHSFGNAEMWAERFDDPKRDAWQEPDAVLDALHLDPAARVADLGAGT